MSEENKLGENVLFEHDHIQETAVEFEKIRNEWQEVPYATHELV